MIFQPYYARRLGVDIKILKLFFFVLFFVLFQAVEVEIQVFFVTAG